jgi:hypothetical protein
VSPDDEVNMDAKRKIEIPEQLYSKLAQIIEGSDFKTVEEFAIYVLNDLTTTQLPPKEERIANEELSEEEIEKIKSRLRNLGYL